MRYLLALGLVALLSIGLTPGVPPQCTLHAQQQEPQQPTPDETVGDEDPAHRGQPKTCANRTAIKASVHDCACHRASATTCERDPSERSSCRVFCRADQCRCSPKQCET